MLLLQRESVAVSYLLLRSQRVAVTFVVLHQRVKYVGNGMASGAVDNGAHGARGVRRHQLLVGEAL